METARRLLALSGMALCIAVLAASCGQQPGPGTAEPVAPQEAAAPVAAPGDFLVQGGASGYQILLSGTASPSEKHAAEELRTHFQQCTGVDLPVQTADVAPETPSIVIGCGPAARALGVDPGPEEIGEQGYVIRSVKPHIVIAGTPAVGTLYGAFDFLETVLGVRWYAPGVTKTPAAQELPFPDVNKTFEPALTWRNTSYEWPGGDEAFRVRQRENDGKFDPESPYGLKYWHDGRCHSYFRYISPGEFFDTHPEYFSEIGGIRRRDETQLCLTNPEVFDIVLERMLKRMEELPDCPQHNFSQMDYYNYCECAECRKINEQYGTAGGTQYWFVNKLAEKTSEVYPDKLIGTLAYMYTEEVPKDIEIHPNVAVWLCHMYPSCQSHPIVSCPLNADFKRRAEGWTKLCKHVYIWYYIVDFAHYYNPYPNFGAMASDLKFYRDIGVEGVYLQAMGHGGGGGEFSLLRGYYGTQLAWNPDQDPQAVMKDFLEGYYGAAWEPIWKYAQLLQNKVDSEDIHMHLYTNPAQGYLPDEVIAEAQALFDQAEAAVASDADLLERVKVCRMPLTYARVFPRNGYIIEDGFLKFQGDRATIADVQEFIDRMKAHGFETIREWGGDPQQLLMLAMALQTPLPVNTIRNEHLTVDVVPVIGGRILRITDNKTGACATAHNTTRTLFFPFAGGEESRVGGVFAADMGGNMEMYQVKESTESSVTLEAAVRGMQLQRILTLEPGKPVLRVQYVLTNTGEKAAETSVRSHLELDMGPVADTRVAFVSRSGEKIEKDMRPIIAGLREGEHYYDTDAPKGTWTFTGAKGLKLTQRFEDEKTDYAWLYAYPEYLNALEVEIWAKPVTVEPGAQAEFNYEIEVVPAS